MDTTAIRKNIRDLGYKTYMLIDGLFCCDLKKIEKDNLDSLDVSIIILAINNVRDLLDDIEKQVKEDFLNNSNRK